MYHIPPGVFPSVLKSQPVYRAFVYHHKLLFHHSHNKSQICEIFLVKNIHLLCLNTLFLLFFHKVIKSIQHFWLVFIKFTWMDISYIHIIPPSTVVPRFCGFPVQISDHLFQLSWNNLFTSLTYSLYASNLSLLSLYSFSLHSL